MNELLQLFNEIHLIIEKHEYIRKEKGDNYNLFKVINMTSDETRVHSAMIADLLNPNGQHQMGDVFLKLFIECLNEQTDHTISFTCDNAKVECEKYIGPKTDTDGGRLDIYLTDGTNHIVIENKIYATDQENQLLRYHNFMKRCSKNKNDTLLLYLSLDGEVYDMDKTTSGEEITFFTISYANFILNWLTDCRHKAIDKPLIREGIAHYLNLIKILTHQMDKEKNELINLIKSNPKYINCISQYKDAIREIEISLQIDFWSQLEVAIENIKNIEKKDDKDDTYKVIKKSSGDYKYALDKHKDYIRRYYESNNSKYQSLEFELEEIDGYKLMYAVQVDWRTYSGVLLRDKEGKIVKPEIAKGIEELQKITSQIGNMIKAYPDRYSSSDFWLLWEYTHPTINFRNLNDGNSQQYLSRMKGTVESISKNIIENINMILKEKHEQIL